jgi:hypothetical protein
MKIIKQQNKDCWPKKLTCSKCYTLLSVNKSDIKQQSFGFVGSWGWETEYSNGFICPNCETIIRHD